MLAPAGGWVLDWNHQEIFLEKEHNKMSISAISAALRATTTPTGEQLATSRIVTLHALATFTNEETHECYPSVETLTRHTGLSRNAIRAAFKDLEAYGWLTRRHRTARTTVYRINIDAITDANRRERKPKDYSAVEAPVTPVEAPVEPVEAETLAPVPAPVQAELIPAAPVKKTKKRSTTTAALDEEFNEFYKHAYPRQMEPLKARRAFEKAVKNGADPREIIEGARRFAAATAAKEVTYIPYPASWLNAGGWMSNMQDAAPVERTPWQAKTARMIQPVQAAAVVNNAPALTGATNPAPAAPLAIEPGYI